MPANLGAHETMELHEILTHTIDGINQLQLYRPHVKDSQLKNILDNQINFAYQEYNNMVNAISQRGRGAGCPPGTTGWVRRRRTGLRSKPISAPSLIPLPIVAPPVDVQAAVRPVFHKRCMGLDAPCDAPALTRP